MNEGDFLHHPDIFAITWKNNEHTDIKVYHPLLEGVKSEDSSCLDSALNLYMLGFCLAQGEGAFQEFNPPSFFHNANNVTLESLEKVIDDTLRILAENLRDLEFRDVKTQLEVLRQTHTCTMQASGYISQAEEGEEGDDDDEEEEEDKTPVRNRARARDAQREAQREERRERDRDARRFDTNLFTVQAVVPPTQHPIPEHIFHKLQDVLALLPSLCHAMISLSSHSDHNSTHPLTRVVGGYLAVSVYHHMASVFPKLTPTPSEEKDDAQSDVPSN